MNTYPHAPAVPFRVQEAPQEMLTDPGFIAWAERSGRAADQEHLDIYCWIYGGDDNG